jgi:ubiquinone/menaquinone biosynthesis C-methylase UbiE
MYSLLKSIHIGANHLLAPIGLELSRRRHDWNDVGTFIPFDETMAKAKVSGLPLGEYIDARQGIAGTTQDVIRKMKELGVFDAPLRSIVEIGPGTGRYLEAILRECAPEHYEIYETASKWASYLVTKYRVVLQPTDGISLHATPDSSVDMVHAQKVLSATTFRTTGHYWCEMVRVIKPGGYAVFDVMTENCLSPEIVKAWRTFGSRSTYPSAIPSKTVMDFFISQDFNLIGSFLSPMPPGQTEVFVFKRKQSSVLG